MKSLGLIVLFIGVAVAFRPVVLMHGLMATSDAMSDTKGWIEKDFPGIYVKNVQIGTTRWDSLFTPLNDQIENFAQQISSDPKLANGFNVIGHSQGALISRGYIQRFNNPPVYNFISWAGPHGGQYGVPEINALCPDEECPWLLELMDTLMNGGWTDAAVQEAFTFATYWKDPFNLDDYVKYSAFLADVNNDRAQKNSTYKKNFLSLNNVLLVASPEHDSIVVPRTSPWFNFFEPNSDSVVQPWNETDGYKGDYIGMQTLYNSGRLSFHSVNCSHHDIPKNDCKIFYDLYTKPLLNN